MRTQSEQFSQLYDAVDCAQRRIEHGRFRVEKWTRSYVKGPLVTRSDAWIGGAEKKVELRDQLLYQASWPGL